LTTLKTMKTENERDKGYKKISELLGLRGCIKAKDLIKKFSKKEKTSHIKFPRPNTVDNFNKNSRN